MVGKEGTGGWLPWSKYPKDVLAEHFGLTAGVFESILNFMKEIELVQMLEDSLVIDKLPVRADDYSKREERQLELKVKKDVKKKEPSTVHELVYFFKDTHQDAIGMGYHPNWGRDCKILKDLLDNTHSQDELKSLIKEFFASASDEDIWWSDKLNVPVFKSVIPKLIGRLRRKK